MGAETARRGTTCVSEKDNGKQIQSSLEDGKLPEVSSILFLEGVASGGGLPFGTRTPMTKREIAQQTALTIFPSGKSTTDHSELILEKKEENQLGLSVDKK